jgi:hypothetical protein
MWTLRRGPQGCVIHVQRERLLAEEVYAELDQCVAHRCCEDNSICGITMTQSTFTLGIAVIPDVDVS